VLNRHEAVADAIVRKHKEGFEVLVAKVPSPEDAGFRKADFMMRRGGFTARMVRPGLQEFEDSFLPTIDAEGVNDWLRKNGYEGAAPASVQFCSRTEIHSADGGHERLAMRKLMRVIFDSVDEDNDGGISLVEFHGFLDRCGLSDRRELLVQAFMHSAQVDMDGYTLEYEQFKFLLRDSWLLKAHGGDDERFAVDVGLLDVVAAEMFAKADADGSGRINADELESMWQAYALGDASGAQKAFQRSDADGDGHIDLKEFSRMLLVEGVVVDGQEAAAKEEEEGGMCAIM